MTTRVSGEQRATSAMKAVRSSLMGGGVAYPFTGWSPDLPAARGGIDLGIAA